MMSPALYSSENDEWSTPPALFAKLNKRYRFTLDPCATAENATCPLFFSKEQDGLQQDWGSHRVFCNPPYGRKVDAWARKSFQASQGGALVVLLVPARTCTRWFHDWVQGKAEVKFIRGRLRFGQPSNGNGNEMRMKPQLIPGVSRNWASACACDIGHTA